IPKREGDMGRKVRISNSELPHFRGKWGGGLGAGTGAAGPAPSANSLDRHAWPLQLRRVVPRSRPLFDLSFGWFRRHVHTLPLPERFARPAASRQSSRSQVVQASIASLAGV